MNEKRPLDAREAYEALRRANDFFWHTGTAISVFEYDNGPSQDEVDEAIASIQETASRRTGG